MVDTEKTGLKESIETITLLVKEMDGSVVDSALVVASETMKYAGADIDSSLLTLQKFIASKTPEQLMNGLTAVAGDSAKGVLTLIKGDEALSKAIHGAISKDATVLPGLQKLFEESDGATTNILPALEKALGNEQLRGKLTEAINHVADDPDINFKQLNTFISTATEYAKDPTIGDDKLIDAMVGVGMDKAKSQEFLAGVKAEETQILMASFLNNLMNGNIELAAGQLGAFLEEMGLPAGVVEFITGMLPIAAEFAQDLPENVGKFMEGSGWDKVGGHISRISGDVMEKGREMLNKNAALNDNTAKNVTSFQKDTVDGEISTDISREEFIDKFTSAMEGKDIKDLDAVKEAVIAADAKMADEMGYIQSDTKLSANFNGVSDLAQFVEKVADLRDGVNKIRENDANMPGSQVVDQAAKAIGMGHG